MEFNSAFNGLTPLLVPPPCRRRGAWVPQ